MNAKQRPNVKKAQGFIIYNKERFDNVYTFRSKTDESNEMDSNRKPSTNNKDSKTQHPEYIAKFCFEQIE